MATDEWQKLYREKAKGDVSERVAVGESLRMLDGLKGIEDLAIALLHDPEPDVRGAALGLYPRRLGARVFCEYLKCLKDEDVRVRRKATHMLGKWTGFDYEVSGLLKLGPDAVETPEELALRAKVIKAVEERKDDKQSNE
jgi:HEAT repeat protein